MTGDPKASAVFAGLCARCPRCGQGRLLHRILAPLPGCERCGLSYAFADAGDGPAVFAIFILGFLILGMALWVEFTFEPPAYVHVLLWGIATPLIALVVLRVLKGLLIALQYRNNAEEARLARKD